MNNKVIIVIVLNLLALTAIGWLGWQITQTATLIKTTRGELVTIASTKTQLNALKTDLATTVTARAQIDQYFLKGNDLPTFIEQLEGLATTTQVSLDLKDATVGTGVTASAKFSLDLGGKFSRVVNFIALVENLPYQLRLNQLELKQTATASSTAWQGSANVEVLSFIPGP